MFKNATHMRFLLVLIMVILLIILSLVMLKDI